jgi:hypothetical protein
MAAGVPPLGLCSWHLENTDLRVPAVTLFEGTALCEACNSEAHQLGEDDTTGLDRIQEAAETHASNVLQWIRHRNAEPTPDETPQT